jgi:hypothetical protein
MKPTGFLKCLPGNKNRCMCLEREYDGGKYPKKDRIMRRMMKRGERNNFKEYLKLYLLPF